MRIGDPRETKTSRFRRREQREIQMWNQIENQLLIKFKQNKKIQDQIGDVRFSLANHQITPGNWFKSYQVL